LTQIERFSNRIEGYAFGEGLLESPIWRASAACAARPRRTSATLNERKPAMVAIESNLKMSMIVPLYFPVIGL